MAYISVIFGKKSFHCSPDADALHVLSDIMDMLLCTFDTPTPFLLFQAHHTIDLSKFEPTNYPRYQRTQWYPALIIIVNEFYNINTCLRYGKI